MLAAQYFKLADFGLASFMGPQGQEVTSIVSVRILLIELAMIPNTAGEHQINSL